jgi:hypothetical protein
VSGAPGSSMCLAPSVVGLGEDIQAGIGGRITTGWEQEGHRRREKKGPNCPPEQSKVQGRRQYPLKRIAVVTFPAGISVRLRPVMTRNTNELDHERLLVTAILGSLMLPIYSYPQPKVFSIGWLFTRWRPIVMTDCLCRLRFQSVQFESCGQ